MSKPKIRTQPDLAATSPKHLEAIDKGSEHFRLWERNVIDRFKDKTDGEIKEELQASAHPFAICMENLIGDFNFGTLVRNANAFGAQEVFYLGDKKWDKRSAVGVYNYTNVNWLPTLDDLIQLKSKYVFIGCDNIAGSVSISKYNYEPNTLFIFGEESVGLTPKIQSLCQDIVHIDQYGSVRSLNVGTASGIICNDFVSKYRAKQS